MMNNLDIIVKCKKMELAIQSVLNEEYDKTHIGLLDCLSNDNFDGIHFLFRSHSWVPLSYAVHSVEQVIGEIERHEIDDYRDVLVDALATLRGEHILIRKHYVHRLNSMRVYAKRNKQAQELISIVDTLNGSCKCCTEIKIAVAKTIDILREVYTDSILWYFLTSLLNCIFEPILTDMTISVSGNISDELISYPLDIFFESWNADSIDWNRVNTILSFILCEVQTVYSYTCFGWRCVDCHMPVFSLTDG